MSDFATRMSQASFQQHLDELREAGDSEALYRAASALNTGGCATGPWEEGRPQEEGRYFVEVLLESGNDVRYAYDSLTWKEWTGWQIEHEYFCVLRYAHINS